MTAPLEEISILLRPLPSSPWITEDPAFDTSVVSIDHEAHKYPGPLVIVGVRLNGLPLRHRITDSRTVVVTPPVPLEGGRLEILCLTVVRSAERLAAGAADATMQGSVGPRATCPLSDFRYGLQAPSSHLRRGHA